MKTKAKDERRPLTKGEKRIINALKRDAKIGGIGMTVPEIGEEVHLTPDGVKAHLTPLRWSGYVRHQRWGLEVRWTPR